MEEFFAALLYGIFELILEFLFEAALGSLVAVVTRSLRRLLRRSRKIPPVFAIPAYFLLGVGLGFASLLFFPHPLIHPGKVHGLSLLISPLLAGLFMSFIGTEVRRRGKQPVRIESFGYGFAFAFGTAIIRLIFAR
jgi:hypothetical protein